MIERGHSLAVTHQCELLALSRSSVYHQPAPVSEQDLKAMRLLDEAHLQFPFYGSRRLSDWLGERGVKANRKRVRRVMRLMGLEALYPRPRTSRAGRGHKVYPYLLREFTVERPNQVWAADICSLPMARGFLYLVTVMDWYSRKVLAWRLSNPLNGDFCIEAVEDALAHFGSLEIFNTDQGAQFTSAAFTSVLKGAGVAISMDGKGRWVDNVFVERLWRSVKYEEVYLHAYESVAAARAGLGRYFRFYNAERRHQGLSLFQYEGEPEGREVEGAVGGVGKWVNGRGMLKRTKDLHKP